MSKSYDEHRAGHGAHLQKNEKEELLVELREISGQRQLEFVQRFDYIREAGTQGEEKAAAELVEELRQHGIEAKTEEFEFEHCAVLEAELTVTEVAAARKKDSWGLGDAGIGNTALADKRYETAGYGYCQDTPEEGIEAPFLYAERGDDINLSFAEGKIVMLNEPINAAMHEKLVQAGAVGFITISGTPADEKEDCLLYSRNAPKMEHAAIPGIMVHHKTAIELVESGVSRVRLRLKSKIEKRCSRNVIVRIEGTETPKEVLTLTAHYDSVPQGVGAYDNMAACAIIFELCCYFSCHKPKRTLEFIWFGAEEKGLLGSRAYVETHASELAQHRFNMNVDLAGQLVGGTIIGVTGEAAVCSMLEYLAHEVGIGIITRHAVWASDSNTFAWKGIPAMTLNRDGFGMHTRHDKVEYISAWSLERSAQLLGYIAEHLANCKVMPFARTIPEEFQKELEEYFNRFR